jgi:hypothetical protein
MSIQKQRFSHYLAMMSHSGLLDVPINILNRSHGAHSDKDSADKAPLYRSCGFAKSDTNSEDLQHQVLKFKEKAHQSFMQVMYPTTHTGRCSNSTRTNSRKYGSSSRTGSQTVRCALPN